MVDMGDDHSRLSLHVADVDGVTHTIDVAHMCELTEALELSAVETSSCLDMW